MRRVKPIAYILLGLGVYAWADSGPGKEIGSGAGTIGAGTAKGTGSAAKGAAQGAGDVVTLHPVKRGEFVGKGAAGAGKDVTVGAVKGTGKIGKGVGKVFKKIQDIGDAA